METNQEWNALKGEESEQLGESNHTPHITHAIIEIICPECGHLFMKGRNITHYDPEAFCPNCQKSVKPKKRRIVDPDV